MTKYDYYILLYFTGYLQFWSVTFIIVTTLVMIFKHEKTSENVSSCKPAAPGGECNPPSVLNGDCGESVPDTGVVESQSVMDAYRQLWRVVQLPAVLSLIVTLLTIKVSKTAVIW